MNGYLPALVLTSMFCPRCGRALDCQIHTWASVEEKTALSKVECPCGQVSIGRWFTPQNVDVEMFRRDEVYREIRELRAAEESVVKPEQP